MTLDDDWADDDNDDYNDDHDKIFVQCLLVHFRAAGGQLMLDKQTICRKSSQIGGRQDEMCRNEPEIIDEVLTGVQLAMEECQIQFQDRRWNCTSDKASMSNLLRKKMGKEYHQLCPFIA